MIPAFDLALSELKKVNNPVDKICSSSAYWIPLQWVYVAMIKNKDLVRLSELPKSEKEKYWAVVKDFDWQTWKKISVAQAIYLFERLND